MKFRIVTGWSLCLLLLLNDTAGLKGQNSQSRWIINKQIEIIPLTEHAYLHATCDSIPGFGWVWSNGLILVSGHKALLFDTPVSDANTEHLLTWLDDSLYAAVEGFIPNHWHTDCMGGINTLKHRGIPSYANELTRELAQSKNLPVPDKGFTDSLNLQVGTLTATAYFLGAAHSMDNIVVWIPSEKILFGGCMVKALSSTTMGYTTDGDMNAWPITIGRVKEKFPDAQVVVPGHGNWGGKELLDHTLDLLKTNSQNLKK